MIPPLKAPTYQARGRALSYLAIGCAMALADLPAATAFEIELDDVAPMRVEWQRRAVRGELPLPGTPDLDNLNARLSAKGLQIGDPVFLRVFKAESELEVWMLKGRHYIHFATYPICHWSGTLGPKLAEGDKQNPEGFYHVEPRQLRTWGSWPKSISLGFPNRFDRAHNRTGSLILVHGGCSSIGCFAMTDPVMNEVHKLAKAAATTRQGRFQFHVFPFRMSDKNMAAHSTSKWHEFWGNLKEGYDAFERTRVPPRVSLCGKRYLIEDANPDEIVSQERMQRYRAGGENTRCTPAAGDYGLKPLRQASSASPRVR